MTHQERIEARRKLWAAYNAKTINQEDLRDQLAELEDRAVEEAARGGQQQPLTMAVSVKRTYTDSKTGKQRETKGGGAMLRGLGRWPLTLYKGQWRRLVEFVKSGAVEKFLADHNAELADKTRDEESEAA